MSLQFRFLNSVPKELKSETKVLAQWLRACYDFSVPLEIRVINKPCLIDFDGTKCFLRWWQSENPQESFKVQVACGNFKKHLKQEGVEVAYPTVFAAIGRGIGYYFQAINNFPSSEDTSAKWGDSLLDAYCDNRPHPEPMLWLKGK